MTSKKISVKEKIYKQLERLKNQDESFSDLFERLIQDHKENSMKKFLEFFPPENTVLLDSSDLYKRLIKDHRFTDEEIKELQEKG